MDKKITIPASIALMVVLAVAGMLAIFSYTAATPVEASVNTGSVTYDAGPTVIDTTSPVKIGFTTNAAITTTTPIIITFSDEFTVGATGALGDVAVNDDAATATVISNEVTVTGVDAEIGAVSVDIPLGITATTVGAATVGVKTVTADNDVTALVNIIPDAVTVGTDAYDSPGKPNGSGDFTVKFTAVSDLPATTGEIYLALEKKHQFGDDESSISIANSDVDIIVQSGGDTSPRLDPEGVTVDTEDFKLDVSSDDVGVQDNKDNPKEFDQITLIVSDTDGDSDNGVNAGIAAGDVVTVIIKEEAGLRNPVEGGTYPILVRTSTDEDWVLVDQKFIPVVISLSDDEASRGDSISVTGKGFKGGTANFWRDGNGNGVIDASAGESILCSGEVSKGAAECSFDLADPFVSGDGGTCGFDTIGSTFSCNLLNATDGEGVTVSLDEEGRLEDLILTLETSMSVTPDEGAPGDTINVQLHDFPAGDNVTTVTVATAEVPCKGTCTVGESGTASFTIEIPNIESGRKTLTVETTNSDADTDLIVTGAVLLATPATVIANQRISLTASGFSGSTSEVDVTITDISVGSQDILGTKVIKVDAGGTWSASLDLPVKSATTSAGNRVLTATDSKGRTGSVTLTIPERAISITPIDGRVGSTVTVTGTNFPARNSNGSSVQVSVKYGAGNEVSATPDSGGRWSATLTVPNNTTIPSNNTVTVSFDDEDDNPVIDTVNHSVPSAVITLTPASGPEGSRVSVVATGFKRYTPLTSVDVGGNPATPVPAPTTDRSGNVEFTFQVPGIETGVQGVTIDIGGTTANSGFTVVEAGGVVGAVTSEVETALEPLMDAGTLDRVFYFNNSTKEWQWYISDPDFASSNNLDDVVSGAPLWVLVTEDTSVLLNDRQVDFTCADGSCWNLIVFP